MSVHLATTYFRPSWQGGNATRALCQSGDIGFIPATCTEDPDEVTCRSCRVRMGRRQRKRLRVVRVAQLPSAPREKAPLGDIADAVCVRHQVSIDELTGGCRISFIVSARHEAMWRMRAAGHGPSAIGAFLNRNRQDVDYGVKRHAERLQRMAAAA